MAVKVSKEVALRGHSKVGVQGTGKIGVILCYGRCSDSVLFGFERALCLNNLFTAIQLKERFM